VITNLKISRLLPQKYRFLVCNSTKTDEKKLAILERKILRQIFGSKKNEETNEYERRTNDDVYELY